MKIISLALVRWFLAAIGVALLAAIPIMEVLFMGSEVTEGSLTETAQEALLAVAILAIARRAWWEPGQRGFAILWLGFNGAMLLREMDGFFTRTVYHGFWKVPVAVWVAIILALAFYHRDSVIRPLTQFLSSPACFQWMIGLLILLVFSRLMGMGKIWGAIQEDPPLRMVKNMVEESLELLGYGIMAVAAIRYERSTGKTWQPGKWIN